MENKNEMIDYTIAVLCGRISSAIASYRVLSDNNQYYDAFMLAGHALETCAILSYIKDCKNESEQIERWNKYFASSSGSDVIQCLELSNNLNDEDVWNAYSEALQRFKKIGTTIIKPGKNHIAIIAQLQNRNGVNNEKLEVLQKNYVPQKIQEYINELSKFISNPDNAGWFKPVYAQYCGYKHANMSQMVAHNIGMESGQSYIADGLITWLESYITKYLAEQNQKAEIN